MRPAHHVPRPAPQAAVEAALSCADARTSLMVRLAAFQGLRRGEIARLRGEDVERSGAGWDLVVHGKGDKDRVIPMGAGLALDVRARGLGWTFPGQIDGHLSPARVGELVSGVLPGGWTAHTLRHRFATAAYAGTRDLVAVQHLLGHSKPETTLNYVETPTDAMRAALRAAA